MLKKKRKILILSVAAVSVLSVVALVGGIISAQTSNTDEARGFAERVASILGLETETVENAIDQAKSEIHDERTRDELASLVEDGAITQDEADEIAAWYDSKPDVAVGRYGWFKHRGFGYSEAGIDRLVEDGTITQAEADALQQWQDARPDALDGLLDNRRGRFGKFGRSGRGGHWFDKMWDSDKDEEGV